MFKCMNKLLFLILLSFLIYPNKATTRHLPIRVAILDTGLDLKDPRFKNILCPTGHKDFTGLGFYDHHGHGTHVAGLIKKYAHDSNYCIIILKYTDVNVDSEIAFSSALQALTELNKIKADIVNFSGGGTISSATEFSIIKNSKQKFIVAAGNDGRSLDTGKYHYYPASYNLPNITIVGSLNSDKEKSDSSNYGDKVVWEIGEDVLSTLPNGEEGYKSGTSMACAIRTGKTIYEMSH